MSQLPGQGHICLQLHVGDEASVSAAFEAVAAEFGQLDGLVNNAGITRDQLILRMKTEDFQSVVDTNLKGTFLCTRAAVKMMIKARSGSIVNITSVIGEMGNAGQSNYAASKAGTEGFSKSIAQEVASRGVRVNCVAPGFIVTEMTDALNEAQKTAILSKVPLNQLGDVNDVASATAFLLSSEAKYITGHTLSVNGGLYM
jgi:3-oxoacyl-[acyl-carrier protein] reductase